MNTPLTPKNIPVTIPQNVHKVTKSSGKEEVMAAVVYTRVSSREQAEEGYSLPAQREQCLRLVAERGWKLTKEFCDAGESARTADRPQFQLMLELLKTDPSIRFLVVHKLDRLARNLEDHVMVRAMLKKYGVSLISVTEGFEETASGKLVEGIMASIAEFYSANLAQEVKKGFKAKLEAGGWPHMAPIGYRNIREESGGRSEARVVIDETQSHLVRQVFELYSTGEYSLNQLHEKMTKLGLRNKRGGLLSRSKLAEMLHNKFYIGKMVSQGVEYQGNHEPLISSVIFSRVQEVLQLKSTGGTRERKHSHHLRGTLFCGSCGARMSSLKAKGHGGIYEYFFCIGRAHRKTNCMQKYVAADHMTELVARRIADIRIPQSLRQNIEESMKAELETRKLNKSKSTKLWTKRLAQLTYERDKSMQAYFAGAITLDFLKQQQERIELETLNAENQIALSRLQGESSQELIETALALMDRLPRGCPDRRGISVAAAPSV